MKQIAFLIFTLLITSPGFSLPILNARVVPADKTESTLEYTLIHPLHTVHGISKDVDCQVNYDDITGRITGVNVSAEVMSFDSGNSNRDSHMAEVVDALDYPDVSFKSDSVEYLGGDSLLVTGRLTFHNVTKVIPVKVAEKFENGKTVVSGSFSLRLTEFKIKRPTLLLMPVKDKLALRLNIVIPEELKNT